MRVGLILERPQVLDGRYRRENEFLEVDEAQARVLVATGAASYADGRDGPRGTTRVTGPAGGPILASEGAAEYRG
jgi:hypothetical protein